MTPRELNRAIARATGESVREIELMGFSEVSLCEVAEHSIEPAIFDGDDLDALLAKEDPDVGPPLLPVAA